MRRLASSLLRSSYLALKLVFVFVQHNPQPTDHALSYVKSGLTFDACSIIGVLKTSFFIGFKISHSGIADRS